MKKVFFLISMTFLLSCQNSKEEANVFFLKGNKALENQNYNEAIKYYEEAVNKNPKLADAYNNLGVANKNQNKNEEAIKNFQVAFSIDSKFNEAKLNLAEIKFKTQGEINETYALLNEIENEYIQNAKFCNLKGQIEFAKSDLEQSKIYLEKAIKLEPKNSFYISDLGTLFYQNKDYKKAIELFTRSIQLNNTNTYAISNLGLSYFQLNDQQTAKKYLVEAYQNNPKIISISNNLAYFYLKTNELKLAFPIVNNSISIDKSDPWAIRNQGLYEIKAGNAETGLTNLLVAYDKTATIENIHTEIGQAYFILMNKTKACEFWAKGKILGETESKSLESKNCN